jgi:hypothetical protein
MTDKTLPPLVQANRDYLNDEDQSNADEYYYHHRGRASAAAWVRLYGGYAERRRLVNRPWVNGR